MYPEKVAGFQRGDVMSKKLGRTILGKVTAWAGSVTCPDCEWTWTKMRFSDHDNSEDAVGDLIQCPLCGKCLDYDEYGVKGTLLD